MSSREDWFERALRELEGLVTLVDLRKNMKHTEKHFADEAIKHHLYLLNLKDTVIIDPEKYILLLQPLIKARCSMEEQHMDATDIGSLIVFRLEALSAGRLEEMKGH